MPSELEKNEWHYPYTKWMDSFAYRFRVALPPKILLIILIIILACIGYHTYYAYEPWVDWYTAFGFCITGFGFFFTIYQLYNAKRDAEIRAKQFAKTKRRETARHYEYCIQLADKMLKQVEAEHFNGNFQLLSVRIGYLVDILEHINTFPSADDKWNNYADKMKYYQHIFHGKPKTFNAYNPTNWNLLVFNVSHSVAQSLGMFFNEEEAQDAAQ